MDQAKGVSGAGKFSAMFVLVHTAVPGAIATVTGRACSRYRASPSVHHSTSTGQPSRRSSAAACFASGTTSVARSGGRSGGGAGRRRLTRIRWGVVAPAASASPIPRPHSITKWSADPETGSRVKSTPAYLGWICRCTTTPISVDGGIPRRAAYARIGGANSAAQHALILAGTSSRGTSRKVCSWPATEHDVPSSARADDRTANVCAARAARRSCSSARRAAGSVPARMRSATPPGSLANRIPFAVQNSRKAPAVPANASGTGSPRRTASARRAALAPTSAGDTRAAPPSTTVRCSSAGARIAHHARVSQ